MTTETKQEWQWDADEEFFVRDGVEQTSTDVLAALNSLTATVERYREALIKYGEHKVGCPHFDKLYMSATDHCTCGLHAALLAEKGE